MLAKMHGVTIQSPKIAKLREHTFAVHELMNSGGLWRDSPVLDPLRQLAVEFRLVFTSTWRVEGQHAKKAAQHAPHLFFLARARCLSAGLRYLRLTRLPRHDRGPVPGGIDPRLAVYARS